MQERYFDVGAIIISQTKNKLTVPHSKKCTVIAATNFSFCTLKRPFRPGLPIKEILFNPLPDTVSLESKIGLTPSPNTQILEFTPSLEARFMHTYDNKSKLPS